MEPQPTQPTPARDDDRTSAGEMYGLAAIALLTDLRMHLGLDPDGSDTFDRAAAKVAEWETLSRAFEAPRSVFAVDAGQPRAACMETLRRSKPLLARLARADA